MNTTQEFVYCLEGDIKNNKAIIYNIYQPKQTELYGNDVIYASCHSIISKLNPTSLILGTIHNHPHGVCEFGLQDAYTLGKSQDIIAGIICDDDTFMFFSGNSLKDSLRVEIFEVLK